MKVIVQIHSKKVGTASATDELLMELVVGNISGNMAPHSIAAYIEAELDKKFFVTNKRSFGTKYKSKPRKVA
jgi:hypothetical protein